MGSNTRPNCTECDEPCIENSLKRRDASNKKHDFHLDCYIAMAWWLDGHDGKPSDDDAEWVEYRRKWRKKLRVEAADYSKKEV
jgi:hypothetical protein